MDTSASPSPSSAGNDKVCRDLPRIIGIGDIHGSLEGLLEDLFYANLTVSKTRCEWRPQSERTLVVQMGDYVDRGAGALESLQCVRDLQAKAKKFNAEVVRLVGSESHTQRIIISLTLIALIHLFL